VNEVAATVIAIVVHIVRRIAVIAIGRAEPEADGKSRREAKSVVVKTTAMEPAEPAVKTTPVEAASGGGSAGNEKRGHRDRCQHHRDVTEHDLLSPSTARMLTDRDGIPI
jgi:hypothetical protein